MSMGSKRAVELHIGRIHLTSMPLGGERRLQEALQRELRALLAGHDHTATEYSRPAPVPRSEGAVARDVAYQVRTQLQGQERRRP